MEKERVLITQDVLDFLKKCDDAHKRRIDYQPKNPIAEDDKWLGTFKPKIELKNNS